MGIWVHDEKDKPIISLGMKGLLYVELVARGPNVDVHSSLVCCDRKSGMASCFCLEYIKR